MPKKHTCTNTDHISKIAETHSFRTWKTIWDINKDKLKRSDPNMLFKGPRISQGGDVLDIPDLKVDNTNRKVDAKHPFKLPSQVLMIRLRILKGDFTPIKKRPYELVLGAGKPIRGETDDNGCIEKEIASTVDSGTLTVRLKAADTDPPPPNPPPNPAPPPSKTLRGDVPVTWQLQIGALNPIQEQAPDDQCVSGVQQRLNNLCLNCGPVNGVLNPSTKASVKAFQELYKITKPDDKKGIPDAKDTQAKLWAVHDGPSPVPKPPKP